MPQLDASVIRELATHTADIQHMRQDMDRLLEKMDCMQRSLADMQTTMDTAKGGWRGLMFAVGIAGTLGAALATVVQWVAHWTK